MSSEPLAVAVVGTGHLGRHHARIHAEAADVELVCVVDVDPEAARACGEAHGAAHFSDIEAIPDRVKAASVAVSTGAHHAVATRLLARGVHCLVEKPLAGTLDEARDLVARAHAAGCVLQVGHVERFNPALTAAMTRCDQPRFIECRRVAPFSFRSQDIGVVLDLMIHDIDIILHLVGTPVVDVLANGVPILTPAEDIANARLTFACGCVADVTASRVAIKAERALRIFQRDSYLSVDLLNKTARYYTRSEKFLRGEIDPRSVELAADGDPQAFVLQNLIRLEQLPVPDVQPLEAELADFVGAVRDARPPLVSGDDAVQAMEVAERILAAVRASLDQTGPAGSPSAESTP